jgi:hypothetical protein
MPPSPAIHYVDLALEQLRRTDMMRSPGKVPEVMGDPGMTPSDGWNGWRAIPSTATDRELDGLEAETRLKMPPLYRDFLKYRHFIDLTEFGVRFERHLIGEWRDVLRKVYFESWPRDRIVDRGLLPFGSKTLMDAGPVCFDTRLRGADGDCPVVFWDHEWEGTEQEVRSMFSGCGKMFECLAFAATADVNFVYHDESDEYYI